MYATLLDFFESNLAAAGPAGAVHPGNADVHRQLVDAVERDEGPELESAIRRHDSRWLDRRPAGPPTAGSAHAAAGTPGRRPA